MTENKDVTFMNPLGITLEWEESSPLPTIESQKDQLAQFMNMNSRAKVISVGDMVQLNEFGKNVYRYPVYRYPNEKQAGVVVEVLENPVIEDYEIYNTVIAVISSKGTLLLYPMYDAYLERTGESIFDYKMEDNDVGEN